jgi:hypothetical protein
LKGALPAPAARSHGSALDDSARAAIAKPSPSRYGSRLASLREALYCIAARSSRFAVTLICTAFSDSSAFGPAFLASASAASTSCTSRRTCGAGFLADAASTVASSLLPSSVTPRRRKMSSIST